MGRRACFKPPQAWKEGLENGDSCGAQHRTWMVAQSLSRPSVLARKPLTACSRKIRQHQLVRRQF